MKLFRRILFWSHLVAGVIAGIAIGIMCLTGVALAFERQIVEWAERDVRRVTATPNAAPLSVDELRQRLRQEKPDFRATSVTLRNDPAAAVAFTAGRDDTVYANPYTGELRAPASTRTHDFMDVLVAWHRYLALSGDHRPLGKLINGICNLAFFGLAVTGLYLWWPRSLTWQSLKAVAIFNWRLTGKPRDFNWHNSIGLWTAPVLIVLTLTAVPISFRWGGDVINRLAGETPAAAITSQGPGAAPTTPRFEPPAPGARPAGYDAILADLRRDHPRWEQITIRTGSAARGRPAVSETTTPRSGSEPLTVTIREIGSWPRTANTTLTVHPYTGETLSRAGYADLSTSRKIRSWTRFLHTGEALGPIGQLIAGLACLGGCILVYTGLALAWRRFFFRR